MVVPLVVEIPGCQEKSSDRRIRQLKGGVGEPLSPHRLLAPAKTKNMTGDSCMLRHQTRRVSFCLLLCLLARNAAAGEHEPEIYLKFDETQGMNSFADSSGHDRNADCRMSGASCPKTGQIGAEGLSVFFAASCPREYGGHVDDCDYRSNHKAAGNLAPGQATECYYSKDKAIEKRAKFITQSATCGSAIRFHPIQIKDGTIMMWYKESGANDGHPVQMYNPLPNHVKPATAATISRTDVADKGWDLSLAGGNGFSVGRIGPVHWGGYWCGKWHLARSGTGVGTSLATRGDSLRGWDHLAWHHLAFVFAGDTTLIYIDGVRSAVFPTHECNKEVSFLGKRTVRYDDQEGVRDIEWSGGSGARQQQNAAGALNNMLKAKEWSTNYFKGYLDDFQVYDHPLDAEAIKREMQ